MLTFACWWCGQVYLLSRVIELRMQGYSERLALVTGLYKTGSIITAAGLVMAIACTLQRPHHPCRFQRAAILTRI